MGQAGGETGELRGGRRTPSNCGGQTPAPMWAGPGRVPAEDVPVSPKPSRGGAGSQPAPFKDGEPGKCLAKWRQSGDSPPILRGQGLGQGETHLRDPAEARLLPCRDMAMRLRVRVRGGMGGVPGAEERGRVGGAAARAGPGHVILSLGPLPGMAAPFAPQQGAPDERGPGGLRHRLK